jgi:hypothetical protein
MNTELAASEQPGTAPAQTRWLLLRQRARHCLQASLAPTSLWPYAALLTPMVITSITATPWLSWAMGLMGLVALNHVAHGLEARLWVVSARRAFLVFVLPLQVLTLAWVGLVAATGQAHTLATAVFPYLALLCLLIAPACRWHRARQARRLPLKLSLPAASLLVALLHGSAAITSLGF